MRLNKGNFMQSTFHARVLWLALFEPRVVFSGLEPRVWIVVIIADVISSVV